MNNESTLQQMQQQLAFLVKNMATKEDLKGVATQDDLGRLEARLGGVETQLGEVETRLGGVEARLDGVETQVGNLASDLNRVEGRVEGLSHDMVTKDDLDHAVGGIREQLDEVQAAIGETFADEVKKMDATAGQVEDHERRIHRLERRAA